MKEEEQIREHEGKLRVKYTQQTRLITRRVAGLPVYIWMLVLASVIVTVAIVVWSNGHLERQSTTQTVTYTCPMHPQIHSTKPGDCPICGMALVPVASLQARKGDSLAAPTVLVTAEEAVRSGIATAPVRQMTFSRDISVIGVLQTPEQNERMITARTRGRIDKLYMGATGGFVAKGAPLYEFYSPDLLSAEQEYLILLHSNKSAEAGAVHDHSASSLAGSARKRLELLGLTEAAISRLESVQHASSTITVMATESGFIVQKLTQVGAYVDEGTPLFQVADLGTLWVELGIPETEIRFVQIGQPVSVFTDAYPGREFLGTVTFLSPVEDAASRTVRIRATLKNPLQVLRPNMPVTARLHIQSGSGFGVPATAVINTGTASYVWVKAEDGTFRRRTVTVSERSPDNFYKVDSGLLVTDTIAISGAFLIDAEHALTQQSTRPQ